MSLSLETLNRGYIEGFGYSLGGVHRVLLGELPAMPTPQFCELATAVLLQAYPRLDEPASSQIGQKLQLAYYRDQQTKVDRENIFDLPQILPLKHETPTDVSAANLGLKLIDVVIPENLLSRLENATELEKSQLFASIRATIIIQNGWTAEPYSNNPFILEVDHISIAGIYHISYREFGLFVAQILAGGVYGWDTDIGMPKSAKKAIAKLQQIWPIHQTLF